MTESLIGMAEKLELQCRMYKESIGNRASNECHSQSVDLLAAIAAMGDAATRKTAEGTAQLIPAGRKGKTSPASDQMKAYCEATSTSSAAVKMAVYGGIQREISVVDEMFERRFPPSKYSSLQFSHYADMREAFTAAWNFHTPNPKYKDKCPNGCSLCTTEPVSLAQIQKLIQKTVEDASLAETSDEAFYKTIAEAVLDAAGVKYHD